MALKIKPVMLKQSIYLRVPSNIADLIGMDAGADVTMTLGEDEDQIILIYSVAKSRMQHLSHHMQVFQPNNGEELIALNDGQGSDGH
jgi:antitoxin component of MazEF toxin-antitoxin module